MFNILYSVSQTHRAAATAGKRGAVLAFAAALLISGSAGAFDAGHPTITYSKSQGPYTILFEEAVVPILEAEGYKLSGTDFSDLLTADIALNDGDVDLNVEQHTAYIENFNRNKDGDLTPISPIPTVPAGIYSSRHQSLTAVTEGARVAIPNDAANTARIYLLLQKIGWLKFDPAADPGKLTADDIVENPYQLVITEMKSLTIPAAIADFDFVGITGSVVYNSGIDPSTALATEDIRPHLVLQVTVKAPNAGTRWAQDVVAAYHSEKFRTYLREHNKGLWWVPEELR